eukprot:TRINITY_DN23597_c0_g1_i1.p1 TRINITY_DN23597_c0_g1~~TRINITY_DN23597_c0_g1_i1.p1  ORF type:complete len:570 (+),score=69.42 TRINITY_DN23597_c0_g1_i1:16-1725(+)
MNILYGTETGTAVEASQHVAREAARIGITVVPTAADNFLTDDIHAVTILVVVCATTGQGDVPSTMKSFWKWLLLKSCPTLPNLHFAVFGLGDSTYPKFNYVAKMVHNRLLQLQAKPLLLRGLGDDQDIGGYSKELIPWTAKLLAEAWVTLYPGQLQPQRNNGLLPSPFSFSSTDKFPAPSLKVWAEQTIEVKLTNTTRVTAMDHFQDVCHYTFSFVGQPFPHEPGDVVAITPQNNSATVHHILHRLGLASTDVIRISCKISDEPLFVKDPVSLMDLFTYHLDIQGTPGRYFFEVLAQYTTNTDEVERLTELSSIDYADDLHKYCTREKRTYVEVLDDFPEVNLPLDRVLELIPRIRPRLFSIASASIADPVNFSLLVATVEYITPYKRTRTGLCTSWLRRLPVGTPLLVGFRKTGFQLCSTKLPIIMIGPGTGVAPFRAFWQHRIHTSEAPNLLFFGARNKSKDFFFAEELNILQGENKLTLITAFSRDQKDKIYVQARIRQHGKEVAKLVLEQCAIVYVAGNARLMPESVREALQDALTEHGNMDAPAAEAYVQTMKRQNRLHFDTWS